MGQVSAGSASTIRFPAAESLGGSEEGRPPGSAHDVRAWPSRAPIQSPGPGGPGHSMEMALGLWGPAPESHPHGWDRPPSAAWRQLLPVLRPLSFVLSTLNLAALSGPKTETHLGGLLVGLEVTGLPHQRTNQLNHQAGLQAQLDQSGPGCGLVRSDPRWCTGLLRVTP